MPVKKKAKSKPVKKMGAAKKMPKIVKQPVKSTTLAKNIFTKSQIIADICGATLLTKKQVVDVMDGLTNLVSRHLKKGAVGVFTMPGLFKIVTVRKPATKERTGVNPFTGEPAVFKAKPARNIVKIRPLKNLKDMVA